MGPQCGRPTQFGRGVTRRSKGSRVTVAGDETLEGACQDALEARRHWRAGWMEPRALMRRGTVLKRPEAPHGANAALWLLGDVSSNPAELCRAVAEASNPNPTFPRGRVEGSNDCRATTSIRFPVGVAWSSDVPTAPNLLKRFLRPNDMELSGERSESAATTG